MKGIEEETMIIKTKQGMENKCNTQEEQKKQMATATRKQYSTGDYYTTQEELNNITRKYQEDIEKLQKEFKIAMEMMK
eukprot:14102459-Ditylum_brightwellii.AAC.1